MEFQKAKEYISNRLSKELPEHLFYHSVAHVQDVYLSAEKIAATEGITGEDLELLLTAAMYHDCGFMVQSKDHERISCDIARQNLPAFGYTPAQVEKICGMIMATRVPQDPHNLLEQIICDADLDYLGREDFFTIGNRLFTELRGHGIVGNEQEWNELQVRFLEKHNYFTKTSIATRKEVKNKYLALLKEQIATT